MVSIRRTLNIRLLTGSAALLLAVGAYAGRRIGAEMQREFDRGLKGEARALVTLTKLRGTEIEFDFADEFMPQFSRSDDPEYFQVWMDGDVLERSRSLAAAHLTRLPGSSDGFRTADLLLPDGAPGRMVQLDFVPQQEDDDHPEAERAVPPSSVAHSGGRHVGTVVLARRREGLDGSIANIQGLLLGGGVVLLLGMGALVSSVTSAGLAPLSHLGVQVQRMRAHSLRERVELPGAPEEIGPLVEKLNFLLGHLDRALTRERQLSADVAHELRTPVAELRNLAEVGSRWPENRVAVERFFGDALQISREMERLIDDLLSLARCESGMEELALEPVALGELVRDSWSSLAAHASERNVELVSDGPGEVRAHTDRALVRRIVDNLLENAVDHGAPSSHVRCAFGPGPRISVANVAPNLEPGDLPHMFERFWRKDPARAGRRHAGVGLSLAAAVARTLGGSLGAALDDGWLVMTLQLPPPPDPELGPPGASATSS